MRSQATSHSAETGLGGGVRSFLSVFPLVVKIVRFSDVMGQKLSRREAAHS